MHNELVCVVCPRSCRLTAEGDGCKIDNVSGNHCPRGDKYAREECIDPRRILTTLVPVANCQRYMLPVRSSCSVPRDKLVELLAEIKNVKVKAPVALHQVIIANIGGTGADIIASMSLEEACNV